MGLALRQAVGGQTLSPSTDILQLSGDLAVDRSPSEVTYDDRQLMKKLEQRARIKKIIPWVLGIVVVGIIGVLGYKASNNEVDFEQAAAMVQEVTNTAEAQINATQTQVRANNRATSTQLYIESGMTPDYCSLDAERDWYNNADSNCHPNGYTDWFGIL